MTKLFAALESINIGGLVLGLALTDLYALFGIISFLVSIVSGIVIIVLKIKAANADGNITKEEIEDISNSIKELKDEVDKHGKDF